MTGQRGQHGTDITIFVERLWRSIKYEEVYRHDYETISDARTGQGRHLPFYNDERLRIKHGRKYSSRV